MTSRVQEPFAPAVERDAEEFPGGAGFAGQLRGELTRAGAVRPDDRRTHRDDVRMPTARETGAECGVTDPRGFPR